MKKSMKFSPDARERSVRMVAEWRIVNASDSCAKHLPIQTLWNMPLLP
jgi:hypothetical protein